MKKSVSIVLSISMLLTVWVVDAAYCQAGEKQPIRAIYIPLADHYPGIVAYEKYRDAMVKADYSIERMKSWPLLRAYFQSGEVDVAFIGSPLAMDMFGETPNFRFIGLMHRDGNALAINGLLDADIELPRKRAERKPDRKVADALARARTQRGRPVECAVPALLSTHTVVLYKYLKDYGRSLAIGFGSDKDVLAVEVAPAKSPAFIKKQNNRGIPAAFEQSLPWADVVETGKFGKIAWYSKDVLAWPNGHVECIVIATDDAIQNKSEALKEVVHYLHQAGRDIEEARRSWGGAILDISSMIRRHIPEHNEEAIVQSLRTDLNVINYRHLNVDPAGLRQIMDLAVEGGILKKGIDIEAFTDRRFSTVITDAEIKETDTGSRGYGDGLTVVTAENFQMQVAALEKVAADPIIVAAVKQHNNRRVSLTEIKEIDRQWRSGGQKTLIDDLQNNRTGLLLKEMIRGNPAVYTEAFACDNQGAVVGEYPRTSDYWQGDEEKFTESFKGGSGVVFTGPMEFDKSTMSFSIQVSLPIRDGARTIGVLVVGIRDIN
ncbi:MAG: ABC transporter substrate-binding protein [Desulfobacterales bacterium]